MCYKTALLRLAIVLGPSYVAAYLTGEMVWVVPTLVGGWPICLCRWLL